MFLDVAKSGVAIEGSRFDGTRLLWFLGSNAFVLEMDEEKQSVV